MSLTSQQTLECYNRLLLTSTKCTVLLSRLSVFWLNCFTTAWDVLPLQGLIIFTLHSAFSENWNLRYHWAHSTAQIITKLFSFLSGSIIMVSTITEWQYLLEILVHPKTKLSSWSHGSRVGCTVVMSHTDTWAEYETKNISFRADKNAMPHIQPCYNSISI